MPVSQRLLNCAVFGANGYLGSHLAHALCSAGHHVQGYGIRAEPLLPNLPYTSLDVANPDDWARFEPEIDAVFFFSGLTGTHQGFEQAQRYLQVNEGGLLHLLERIRASGRKPKIIFPSTRLVYRGSDSPQEEDAPELPKSIYAINKLACEQILRAYHLSFDIPYVTYRICVPYGSFLKTGHAYGTIGLFLGMAKAGKSITLFGDGSQRRTLTHAREICRQIIDTAFLPETTANVFNISGEDYSLKEIADEIARKYGVSVEYRPWPKADLSLETGSTVFDDTRIRHLLSAATPLHTFASWVKEL